MTANSITGSDPVVVELTAAVQKLAQRIDSLEKGRNSGAEHASDAQVLNAMRIVQASTEALFGGDVALDRREDPEIDERYFVVRVKAAGGHEEVAERYREWHRKLGDWAPGLESQFRLSVEINDEK